jgi:phosphoglycerol transferase MdoB-like AlkP superfamily enzyme
MPVIQSLNNASNASFVMQYGAYTDFNLWVLLLAIALILMLASRYLPPKDDTGRFITAVLAVIFGVAVVWGSLGVAHFDYMQGATYTNTTDVNESIVYNYIYPVQQVIATPWLTGVCVVILIFAVLNAIDIFLIMMQRPNVDDMKKRGGRGLRI